MTDHHHDEPTRDPELGAALRALPVPEHGPGFDERLQALLEEEAPAVRDRARGRSRARRPSLVAGRSRRRLLRPLVAGAAVAGVLTVVVAGLDEDGSGPLGPLGPERASAAAIVARAQDALASARSLSGVLVLRDRASAGEPVRRNRIRFALTARGDVRILGGPDGDVHYDARSATQVLRVPAAPGPYVETGLAPGAPDPGPADRVLQGGLAAVARSLAASGDAAVAERDVAGRRAWVLSGPTPVNKLGFTGDRLEVAVDRSTGLPLVVRETLGGRLVRELRLSSFEVDPPLPRRTFRPRVPAATVAARIDAGFRTRSLTRARSIAGYAPLTPERLPEGFAPAETRVAETTVATGAEGLNPPSVDVVSTAYRRGLDRVLVTTRRRGGADLPWTDPITPGEGFRVRERRIRLGAGALAGETARVVIDPRVVPHLWILTDDLVVTISGPLSRGELLTAAESLAPAR